MEFYTRLTICDNSLEAGVDFNWTGDRSSYAQDWGLICSQESKGSNLKSFFFVGAAAGLIVSTAMFDIIGRKMTTLIAFFVAIVSAIASTFVNSYNVMLPLRIAHGFGTFVIITGADLLALEFTPSKLRNLSHVISSCSWTIGTWITVGISYGLKDWHHIFLATGCIIFLLAIPFSILPESPRFHLVKEKESEARTTFKKMAKLFNTEKIPESVEITYTAYTKNYLGQIKDLFKYPMMLKNTVILMVGWMMIAVVSYGLTFSWGKLGINLYLSIFISSLVGFSVKGSGLTYYGIKFFGRKNFVVFAFAGLCITFLLSIACYGIKLSATWRLEQVVCLCSSLFISSTWGPINLLTKELSPTSHRGMICCICSVSARIGAIIGPYLALLYNDMDARFVLGIFAGLSGLAALVSWFNADSTGKPIPSTPDDIVPMKNVHKMLEED